ncbi:MAG: right-handed parallel beta-helix repeat-containing protein [Verrucomicrobia bacterium]|nr:right-handed parallel beta-helix repeat-containing protein [Verrucomicrobiota bacterium]MCG2678577.1 right-handed parallel beta-helix repeat-containing protein [Kiritimatiellia bacterium]MBU4248473.1 right-handed parallel beta-helix repeat-containing protein [Verrucomicrobiota bacterium]MBU4291570.1 right-handed parallel beta-helix repeat-containing protein [Verrucomicrobiota bacterium]MBU4427765.1 right-handed parallel beta-helix repeat-containing protein [Verrucomicrobiota bacterium]
MMRCWIFVFLLAGVGLREIPAQEKAAPPPSAASAPQVTARIEFLSPAPFLTPLPGGEKGSKPGIVISGGTANSADIAAAIQDPNKFKKEGDNVTLLAYLLVKRGAALKIANEKWVFGDSCTLQVQGALQIDRSEITSSNQAAGHRGRIQIPHNYAGWALKITDSKISYMDGVGSIIGSAGAPKEPAVFAGNEVVHCGNTPMFGSYVINNWFHDNFQSDGNGLLDTGGLFDGNLIENCAVNYLSISWGGGATIANNIYRNLGAIPGGVAFRQKEGEKGSFVRNNLFHDGKVQLESYPPAMWQGKHGACTEANPAIGYAGSTAKEWGEVSGNIIHHWQGVSLGVSGNGYMGRRDVKCRILDNFFFRNSKGINLSQAKNFKAEGSGPIDVVIRGNSFFDSGAAISGKGEKLVCGGNFVDGKFVDDAPADLDKNFLRIALAPAAVWHQGRIQTITVAVVGLKPLKKVEIKVSDPDGREIKANLQEVKETEYAHDYLGEISTAQCKVGKGTITISGQDADGKTCQVTKEFEIRKMPF